MRSPSMQEKVRIRYRLKYRNASKQKTGQLQALVPARSKSSSSPLVPPSPKSPLLLMVPPNFSLPSPLPVPFSSTSPGYASFGQVSGSNLAPPSFSSGVRFHPDSSLPCLVLISSSPLPAPPFSSTSLVLHPPPEPRRTFLEGDVL